MGLKESLIGFYIDSTIHEIREFDDDTPSISHADLLYLDMIYFNSGCTSSHLADTLNVARSAVTIRLNRMVDKGWIRRVENPKDRREKFLYLTPKLEKKYMEAMSGFDTYADRLKSEFTEEEIDVFCRMIDSLRR